jgi:hypothetical protein
MAATTFFMSSANANSVFFDKYTTFEECVIKNKVQIGIADFLTSEKAEWAMAQKMCNNEYRMSLD